YQLTMAYGYWKTHVAERESVFHLYFRQNPFGGGYTIAAGLARVIDLLDAFHFDRSDLDYLATLRGADDEPLFDREFIDWLGELSFTCDLDAVPEGTVVFPQEPLLRIVGPVAQCQLLETLLLNIVNFETLIATKAARIVHAAGEARVLEFGLRRAQGLDGGLSASRAAYLGGAAGTSNVLAGKLYGIPVRGTHAHAWVMLFEDEAEAFERYADALPNNCVFLVDTYDTLEGVERAIAVGKKLRERGHALLGVRLDSGDLAYLSRQARERLDAAGFTETQIVASNDLDERIITSLNQQGAAIGVWGVGTRLATAFDQPALGGVFKLSAIQDADGTWQPRIKLSEQAVKTSTPGKLQVRRYRDSDGLVADLLYDELRGLPESGQMIDPLDSTRRRAYPCAEHTEDLLVPVYRRGERVYSPPALETSRTRRANQMTLLHTGLTRFEHPHQYPVGLERGASEAKTALILKMRGHDE
ncbi:MAG: nicotinate phosphoribosyltransferase, partial [Myxococcota bacterium]